MGDTLDILTEAMSDYFDLGEEGDAYLAGSYVAEHIAKKMTHQRIVELDDLRALLAGFEYDFTDGDACELVERIAALIGGCE